MAIEQVRIGPINIPYWFFLQVFFNPKKNTPLYIFVQLLTGLNTLYRILFALGDTIGFIVMTQNAHKMALATSAYCDAHLVRTFLFDAGRWLAVGWNGNIRLGTPGKPGASAKGPKPGAKQLEISFNKDSNYLICAVDDAGAGDWRQRRGSISIKNKGDWR